MVALSHIKFIGILTNCKIGSLVFKTGGGEAREVKMRDTSAILTGICSFRVIFEVVSEEKTRHH